VLQERQHERVIAARRAAVGDDAFNRAWRDGRAMALEDTVRYAPEDKANPDA
jgi:hypothetical protein